jgi:hypothetical protein
MSSSNSVRVVLVEEQTLGVTPAVKAFLVVQALTYTADAYGESGNLISIAYTGGGTAGSEVVTVVGNAISVQIQSGTSTATQIKTAVDASVAASALISVAISGSGAATQVTASALFLATGYGDFTSVRFTSESLSATPETTESKQIRIDRMSSGQVVTGLTVEGSLSFELAKESAIDQLMEGAMLNDWDVLAPVTVDLTINGTAKTITRATGIWSAALEIGDILTLSGFTNAGNNCQVQIMEFVSNTVIRVVANDTLVTEIDTANIYTRADKLTIGSTKKSYSLEKAFTDLTTKALIYKGEVVNTMSLNVAYGEIITGEFGFNGTKYENADASNEFITDGKTILAAATTNSMNGSIDMPFINSDVLGTLDEVSFCIQSLAISLNNNYIPQTCIGEAAPKDYSPGTAAIEISMSTYLSNINWGLLAKKLSQEAFSVGFMVKNLDGWYGFYLPAIQVSFADPSSGGANQEISLDMSGTARVGNNGESAIVIYRS